MRAAGALAGLLLLPLLGCADDGADAVVDRTRTTTATYAIYSAVFSRTDEGDPDNGWAAEFHSGDWHRGEGPKFRVVANCRTHVGFTYDVETQQTREAPNAYAGACGIYDAPDAIASERLAPVTGKYGKLDMVKVTDPKFTRVYAIDQHGVIVRSDWTAKNGSPAPCIRLEPIAITNALPPGNIFSAASLKESVVAARYRVAPRDLPKVGLSGKRCNTEG